MDDFPQEDPYTDEVAKSSITGPIVLALIFAAIAFVVYGVVFGGLVGGEDDLTDLATVAPPTSQPTTTTTATIPPLQVDPTPTPTPTPTSATPPTPSAAGDVGAGISVQVIAGADTTGQQFNAAVEALQGLGYDVTQSGSSPNAYPQTTVFATAGDEANADALVAADPRFTTTAANPGTLTSAIQIHVLVGEDWPSS